jgi:hypothetical protein
MFSISKRSLPSKLPLFCIEAQLAPFLATIQQVNDVVGNSLQMTHLGVILAERLSKPLGNLA